MSDRDEERAYAAVLVLSTVVFAALWIAVVSSERIDDLDVRFVRWVHGSSPEALVDSMGVLTYLGGGVFLGALAIFVSVALARAGRTGAAWLVLAAFALSQVVDQTLKATFRRARPDLDEPYVQLTTYAFPSGHAFAATATYAAIALVLVAQTNSTRRRAALLVAAGVLVAVVAASRVVLGRHFLIDVLAGIAGGLAVLAALLLLLRRARHPSVRVVLFARQEEPQRPRLDP